MKKLVGILIVLGAFVSLGAEPSLLAPMHFNGHKIETIPESYPTMVEALEKSFPLVANTGNGDPSSVWQKPPNDYNAAVQANQKNLQTMFAQFQQSVRETVRLREARLKPSTPTKAIDETSAPAPAPEKVSPFSKENWKAFCECAPEGLAALKMKERVHLSGGELAGYEIESQLAHKRGDGAIVSSEGLSCGKFLGQYGMKVGSLGEDVATLAALSLPQTAALQAKVWRYYQLYRAPSSRFKAPDFWAFAWSRVKFGVVVAHGEIPEPNAWAKAYVDYRMANVSKDKAMIQYKPDEKALRDAISEDWKNVTIPTEVSPCSVE